MAAISAIQSNGKQAAPTKHVAVFAFPFGSHAGPLLSLIRRLSEAAPDIRFSFFSTAKSNESIFPNSFVGNIKAYNVNEGSSEGNALSGNPLEVVDLFLKGAANRFKMAMDAARAESGEEIGCLISDAFFWFVGDMAREMEVPWLAFWTSGPRPLFLHLETDLILQTVKSSGSKVESLDFLPGFSSMRVSDLSEEVISGNFDSPFVNMLYNMGLHLPQANVVIINSFEEIDLEMLTILNSKFHKFLNVGPFNLTSPPRSVSDEHCCLQWLDQQEPKSVVYISFGGYITPPPLELAALAEALSESGFPYLWSFRGKGEEKLPKEFLENANGNKGKIVPWAPQLQVLKHSSVGVFVTHGGWNSVIESIAGGVPMIGRPFLGDQVMNVRTVELIWGIGVGLDGDVITKNGFCKALEQVLMSEKGKEMRHKVGALQGLAHKAVEPMGSSSTNFSSLVEMITQ